MIFVTAFFLSFFLSRPLQLLFIQTEITRGEGGTDRATEGDVTITLLAMKDPNASCVILSSNRITILALLY